MVAEEIYKKYKEGGNTIELKENAKHIIYILVPIIDIFLGGGGGGVKKLVKETNFHRHPVPSKETLQLLVLKTECPYWPMQPLSFQSALRKCFKSEVI